MPICFLCSGVIFIFILFNLFNANFFGSKINFSLFLLYISFQIFSFFLKDINYLNISLVYYVPIIFVFLILLFNVKRIKFIKCLTLCVMLATTLIAIGFIDNSFIDFIENNIFVVCLTSTILIYIFSSNVIENIFCVLVSFAIFVAGLTLKQNVNLLTDVTLLNCIMLTLTLSLFLNLLKYFIKSISGVKDAKIKKI